MKKSIIIILNIILTIAFIFSGIAAAQVTAQAMAEDCGKYYIIIDDNMLDKAITTMNIDNLTYVPLSSIQKGLNLKLVFDANKNYMQASWSNNTLIHNMNTKRTLLNGKSIDMNLPIIIRSNLIYFPAIYISDIFGFKTEILDEIKSLRLIKSSNAKIAGEIIEKYAYPAAAKHDKKGTQKVAYLTFDDGPDKRTTPKVLDILKENNIKATFFIVGSSISHNKDLLKRMSEEGHSIGNHTFTHRRQIIYSSPQNLISEIKQTNSLINSVTGKTTILFRPPYGTPYVKAQEYKAALRSYKVVGWNIDSMDSRSTRIKSDQIAKNVIAQVRGKSCAIILLHDSGTHIESVKALPQIIKYLKDNGYAILPIEENTELTYEY